MVSGSLLVATLFLTLLLGWIGLVVTAVVTALVFAWARPPQQAVAAQRERYAA